jgi:hypothetical protein
MVDSEEIKSEALKYLWECIDQQKIPTVPELADALPDIRRNPDLLKELLNDGFVVIKNHNQIVPIDYNGPV